MFCNAYGCLSRDRVVKLFVVCAVVVSTILRDQRWVTSDSAIGRPVFAAKYVAVSYPAVNDYEGATIEDVIRKWFCNDDCISTSRSMLNPLEALVDGTSRKYCPRRDPIDSVSGGIRKIQRPASLENPHNNVSLNILGGGLSRIYKHCWDQKGFSYRESDVSWNKKRNRSKLAGLFGN